MVAVFVLLLLATGAFARLTCTEIESLNSSSAILSQPFLARQRIFDENLVVYNRASGDDEMEMFSRKRNRLGYFNSSSTENSLGKGRIVTASLDFQSWAAVYFQDTATPSSSSSSPLFVAYLNTSGALLTKFPALAADAYTPELPIASHFHEKVGHILITSLRASSTPTNNTFALLRTGEKFLLTGGDFLSVQYAANANNLGTFRASTVDAAGELFLVIEAADEDGSSASYFSLTYKTNKQEAPSMVNRVQRGGSVPVAPGHTVRAVASNSAGAFLILTSQYNETSGLTSFHRLHAEAYGYAPWTQSLEMFALPRVVVSATTPMIKAVWAHRWLLFINTLDGVLALDVDSSSPKPFLFEWTNALAQATLMFAANSQVGIIPPSSALLPFFMVGTPLEGEQRLARYVCVSTLTVTVPSTPSAAATTPTASSPAMLVAAWALLLAVLK